MEHEAVPDPALQALHVLGATGDSDLQEIVDLAAEICDARWAAIAVLSGEYQHLLVTHGLDPLVCPRTDSLSQHTMNSHHLVATQDARADERFRGSPYVDGRVMSVRFYASAPIYAPSGDMVGRLLAFHPRPHRMTPLQERALVHLAESVTAVLELRLRRELDSKLDEEELARIAAQVGHDMQVPLASIVGNVELLAEELSDHEDPAVSLMLARAERGAHRLLRMVQGLMRYHEVGRHEVRTAVDLQALVGQVLAELSPQLDHAAAKVVVNDLPVVNGDPDELFSVLQNLFTNAIKFARPGVPPEVAVGAEPTTDGWRVLVSDNGVGIPPEMRQRVFAMFHRVDTRVEGHGIGLATVRRIVQAHGGRVGIDEAPGGGAQVWFELPARGVSQPML